MKKKINLGENIDKAYLCFSKKKLEEHLSIKKECWVADALIPSRLITGCPMHCN